MKDQKKLILLHSNDIHGDFNESLRNDVKTGGLPRLSGFVHRTRQMEKNVIYAMAGDMFMGSIIDSEYRGFSTIRLANAIEPDVFAIGNHELDYGLSHLLFLEKCADFPIICGNIYIRELNRRLFSAYMDVIKDGVRVRFIGLLTESIAGRISQEDIIDEAVRVRPALDELSRISRETAYDPADITILLTHLGIEEDKILASALDPGMNIDFMIGGHSHTFMKEPLTVNGIPIVQAGFGSGQIGRFDISFDPAEGKIRDWSWQLLPVDENSCEEDPLVSFYLDRFQTETDRKYDQVLFTLPCAYLHTSFHKESPLLDLFADIFRECFSTDIFLVSSNILRAKELGPEVTRRDMMIALPYDNGVYELKLTGKRLKDMLSHIYRKESWEGANVFFLLSGSIKLKVRKEDKEILSAEFKGQPLEADRIYSVGINTYAYRNMETFLGIPESALGEDVTIRRLSTNDKEDLETFFRTKDHFELENEGRLTLV
ncbi:MAG: bifunctional metallophosphatase/5'-nucleotidase [Lachnospiraceae bacterium]|nr:bifunctional metallophosphatase/5'-nucleotidase [Lachnospiraceae bacterium]